MDVVTTLVNIFGRNSLDVTLAISKGEACTIRLLIADTEALRPRANRNNTILGNVNVITTHDVVIEAIDAASDIRIKVVGAIAPRTRRKACRSSGNTA